MLANFGKWDISPLKWPASHAKLTQQDGPPNHGYGTLVGGQQAVEMGHQLSNHSKWSISLLKVASKQYLSYISPEPRQRIHHALAQQRRPEKHGK